MAHIVWPCNLTKQKSECGRSALTKQKILGICPIRMLSSALTGATSCLVWHYVRNRTVQTSLSPMCLDKHLHYNLQGKQTVSGSS